VALGIVAAALEACAPKAPALPGGPGTPFADYAAAYDQATGRCRGIKAITASMALSGTAGSTKLRGRIDAGFAEPARARLEGIPPFGKPVFILVADGPHGTLLLTRDNRVLRDAPPDAIVDALAGVALGPDALRTVVSGCGFADGAPSAGSEIHAAGNDWVRLTFASSTAYLVSRSGTWHLAAATRGPLTVTYTLDDRGWPASIGIRAVSDGRVTADIHLRLSDVDRDTTLEAAAFRVDVPADAAPLTLDELRRAGPLGEAR